MNAIRPLCLLLLVANAVLIFWQFWRPQEMQFAKPAADPDKPSLILRQEYLQLEKSKQRLTAAACWILGPFDSEKQMQDAWQSLEYIALDMQSSKTVLVNTTGYQVVIPPSGSDAEAQSLLELLITAGLDGGRVITDGPMKHAVSMGRTMNLEDSLKKQKLAQELGLEAVLSSSISENERWQIIATVRNQEGFRQWRTELTPQVPVQPCQSPKTDPL